MKKFFLLFLILTPSLVLLQCSKKSPQELLIGKWRFYATNLSNACVEESPEALKSYQEANINLEFNISGDFIQTHSQNTRILANKWKLELPDTIYFYSPTNPKINWKVKIMKLTNDLFIFYYPERKTSQGQQFYECYKKVN